jgi:DNA-directed RNA polymerase subunit B
MRTLVETYFKERSIVNHQIASFDDFLATIDNPNSRMQRIVDSTKASPEDAEGGVFRLDPDRTGGNVIEIRFGRKRDERTGAIDSNAAPTITVARPMIREANGASHDLYPMEARLRNLNYSAPIFLDYTIIEDGIEREPEHVHIGDLPIMSHTKKCNLHADSMDVDREPSEAEHKEHLVKQGEDLCDSGGYFIIGGSERVLISLEDLAPNRVMVEVNERYGTRIEVAKVFSQREGYRALTLVEKKRDGMLMVSVPAVSGQIPLVALMKALGMESDEDIYKAIASEEAMKNIIFANIEECQNKKVYPPNGISTTEDAILYLERKFATGQAKEYRIKKV